MYADDKIIFSGSEENLQCSCFIISNRNKVCGIKLNRQDIEQVHSNSIWER